MKGNRIARIFSLALSLVGFAVGVPGFANTITVNSLADEAPMTDNGLCSLREALQNANNDSQDQIDCEVPGLDDIIDMRGLSGTLTLSAALPALFTNLTILGPGPEVLTVQAGGAFRIFETSSGSDTINISGLTLRGGAPAAGPGGAIFLQATDTLNLGDCVVTGNQVANNDGGGIFSRGTLNVDGCVITDNHVSSGVGRGGGIASEGDLTLRNSLISGNTAANPSEDGGGIAVVDGSFLMVNSTVSGNSATNGGGIFFTALSPPLNAKILSSTITANQALDSEGGGIAVSSGNPANVVLEIQNTLIAGNSAALEGNDCSDDDGLSGTITSLGYNLLGDEDQCAGEFNAAGDQVGTTAALLNPLLGPLAGNGGPTFTHRLLAGSPAVDAGDPSGCRDENGALLNLDQRGFSRTGDGDGDGLARCDIGAFEVLCGDGVLGGGESCDDGNAVSGDGCEADCTVSPSCGDGTVDLGEGCDEGGANSDTDPGACRLSCQPASCGDGVVDPGEACDDGNGVDEDACGNDCQESGSGKGTGSGGCGLAGEAAPSHSSLAWGSFLLFALGALWQRRRVV